MIYSRDKVRQAYARAFALNPDSDAAVAAVAQALGLPVEVVAECVEPSEVWCCQIGEALGVRVCDECAEASMGYSAAMAPVREGETC